MRVPIWLGIILCVGSVLANVDEDVFNVLAGEFFFEAFEQRHEMFPSTPTRTAMLKHVMRIQQVDAILRLNRTVYNGSTPPFSPLIYSEDLMLTKVVETGGQKRTALKNNREWGHSNTSVVFEKVHEAFNQGFTLIFNRIQQRWPPVAQMARMLESVINGIVNVNLYLSPSRTQGFETHIDVMDVMVVQIYGRKAWKVYAGNPAFVLPRVDQKFIPEAHPSSPHYRGTLERSVTLNEGDLLYLPRGTPHEASTTEGISLHLSFGIDVYDRTWESFFHYGVSKAAFDGRDAEVAVCRGDDGTWHVARSGVTLAHLMHAVLHVLGGEDAELRAVVPLVVKHALHRPTGLVPTVGGLTECVGGHSVETAAEALKRRIVAHVHGSTERTLDAIADVFYHSPPPPPPPLWEGVPVRENDLMEVGRERLANLLHGLDEESIACGEHSDALQPGVLAAMMSAAFSSMDEDELMNIMQDHLEATRTELREKREVFIEEARKVLATMPK